MSLEWLDLWFLPIQRNTVIVSKNTYGRKSHVLNGIMSVLIFFLSIGSFIIAYRHFRNKGELLNNAYMYASAKERKNMDKNPPISRVQVLGAFEVIEIQY